MTSAWGQEHVGSEVHEHVVKNQLSSGLSGRDGSLLSGSLFPLSLAAPLFPVRSAQSNSHPLNKRPEAASSSESKESGGTFSLAWPQKPVQRRRIMGCSDMKPTPPKRRWNRATCVHATDSTFVNGEDGGRDPCESVGRSGWSMSGKPSLCPKTICSHRLREPPETNHVTGLSYSRRIGPQTTGR